jgi:hypothetical protein
MATKGVARVNKDSAGGVIVTGAASVQVNDSTIAAVNLSTIGGPPNTGDVLAGTPALTVIAEDQAVATVGTVTAKGLVIGLASPDVFAG